MSGVPHTGTLGLALLDRPSVPALVVAVGALVAGWAFHLWSDRPLPTVDPGDTSPIGDRRPDPIPGQRLETPAVVALLTNGFEVPRSAITATAVDLAARGWIRLGIVDDELVVITRGQGAAGDALQTYEQHVLGHLSARAFNDVTSAGTLAISQYRLDRRWRQRFAHAVADHAHALGLSQRRHGFASLAPGLAAAAVAAIALTVRDHPWHGLRFRRLVAASRGRACRHRRHCRARLAHLRARRRRRRTAHSAR